jgi:hypothetical protein
MNMKCMSDLQALDASLKQAREQSFQWNQNTTNIGKTNPLTAQIASIRTAIVSQKTVCQNEISNVVIGCASCSTRPVITGNRKRAGTN